jgi:hypothetical protein
MPGYQRLADERAYSPPPPTYRTYSNDLDSTELRNFDSTEPLRPSRNPFEDGPQPSGTEYEVYRHGMNPNYQYSSGNAYNGLDPEAKGSINDPQYHMYKRRWIGLGVLTLLNFASGWGTAAPGVVSTTATRWYDITYPMLNNLGIASSLSFLIPAPFVIWILNKYGPKMSIVVAACLTLVGNWVIYAGTRAHSFPVNVVGTIIAALSQPFALAAPVSPAGVTY